MPNPVQTSQAQLEMLRQRAEEANDRELETLIGQIKEARQEVSTALSKLVGLADDMRNRARRSPGQGSSSMVTFASAHLRFAGAARQGMTRTASMDRVLERAKTEKEEAKRREAQEHLWAEARKARNQAQKQVDRLVLPTDDAFDELYGEVVNNA